MNAKGVSRDPDAFGELVRKSRAKAFGLAYSITQDHHLAEDVVQEALVRAFLRLGTLVDTNRFTPWLAKIVRNEAYMKLRRGGPYRRERHISLYIEQRKRSGKPAKRLLAPPVFEPKWKG